MGLGYQQLSQGREQEERMIEEEEGRQRDRWEGMEKRKWKEYIHKGKGFFMFVFCLLVFNRRGIEKEKKNNNI